MIGSRGFRRYVYRPAVWGATIAVCLSIFVIWLRKDIYTNMNRADYAGVVDMIYGRAYRPYVFRTLVPSAVRIMRSAIPTSVASSLQQAVLDRFPFVDAFMSDRGWETEFLIEYAITLLLDFLSLLGFAWAMRLFFTSLYHAHDWVADTVPVLALLTLPVFFLRGTHYLYDFPTLALFTMMLALLRRKLWTWLYPVFVLGLLNKETTILITFVFALYFFDRMDRRPFFRHAGAQVALFIGVRAALAMAFRSNPGSLIELHFGENVSRMFVPYDLTAFATTLVVLISIFHNFAAKPAFLRIASALIIPLGALYILGGMIGELRVFYEAFPILFLLSFHSLASVMGWPLAPLPEGSSQTTIPSGLDAR